MKIMKLSFLPALLVSLLSLLSINTYAKNITLYDQPSDTARQVGTVDIAQGVVPIFSQNDGKWMKVGDPRNGNVGWIKSSDMSGETGAAVTYTQRTIDNGNGPRTYQFIQYGPSPQMPAAQQKMLQDLQAQQNQMQNTMQQMMNNAYNPIFVPIIYVPLQPQHIIGRPSNNPSISNHKPSVTIQTAPVNSRPGRAITTSPGAVQTGR